MAYVFVFFRCAFFGPAVLPHHVLPIMPPPLDVPRLQPQPKWKSRSEGRSRFACNMMKVRAGALPSGAGASTDKAKSDAMRAAIESTTHAMIAVVHGKGSTFWQTEPDGSVLRRFMTEIDMSPFDRDVLLSFLHGRYCPFADGPEIHRILDQMKGTMVSALGAALNPDAMRKHNEKTKKRKMECQDKDCPWGRCSACRYSFIEEFDKCFCNLLWFKRRRAARKQLGLDADSEDSAEFEQQCEFEWSQLVN